MNEILGLIRELLAGDHFWDYTQYIEEGNEHALRTQNLVNNLKSVLDNPPPTDVHIEIHGGLLNDVFNPHGVPIKSAVFYTNKNDFSGDEDYEDQIMQLYELIADSHGNDKLIAYYKDIQRKNKRTLGIPEGSYVYIQFESEYAISTYTQHEPFYADVVKELGDDLFVVKSKNSDKHLVVHIDDIHSPDSQTM